MKRKNFSQNQKPAGAPSPTGTANPGQNEKNFAPSPDEVARKAYFSYVNQGSPQGHEVQHWLEAEAQLLEDRNRTRTHSFHNKT